LRRALCLAGIALALAGCQSAARVDPTPSFYRDLGRSTFETVDGAMAAQMISGHRRNHGLGPVVLDPRLTEVARQMANEAARSDDLSATSRVALRERLARAGMATGNARDNTSAGYRTLAEAFSGWRGTRPHDAVMRHAGATHMGIATVTNPASRYRVFWVLVMAGPDGTAALAPPAR
jgi:uncharacterized protein YkwD